MIAEHESGRVTPSDENNSAYFSKKLAAPCASRKGASISGSRRGTVGHGAGARTIVRETSGPRRMASRPCRRLRASSAKCCAKPQPRLSPGLRAQVSGIFGARGSAWQAQPWFLACNVATGQHFGWSAGPRFSSCPDLIRASIPLAPQRDREANGMDCRGKPGNDDGWAWAALESPTIMGLRRDDAEQELSRGG